MIIGSEILTDELKSRLVKKTQELKNIEKEIDELSSKIGKRLFSNFRMDWIEFVNTIDVRLLVDILKILHESRKFPIQFEDDDISAEDFKIFNSAFLKLTDLFLKYSGKDKNEGTENDKS